MRRLLGWLAASATAGVLLFGGPAAVAGASVPAVRPVALVDASGVADGDVVSVGAAVFGVAGVVRVEGWGVSGCSGPPAFSGVVDADGSDVVWAGEWTVRAGGLSVRATFVDPVDGEFAGECVELEPVAVTSPFDAVVADGRVRLSGGPSAVVVAERRLGGCDGSVTGSVSWTHDGSVSVSPVLPAAGDSVRVVLGDAWACVAGELAAPPSSVVSDRTVTSESAGLVDELTIAPIPPSMSVPSASVLHTTTSTTVERPAVPAGSPGLADTGADGWVVLVVGGGLLVLAGLLVVAGSRRCWL